VGQILAGFVLTGFYEDHDKQGEKALTSNTFYQLLRPPLRSATAIRSAKGGSHRIKFTSVHFFVPDAGCARPW